LQMDALDFAIGGNLSQEGHPLTYERKKPQDRKQRYPIHEKERTTIVHFLQAWRDYFLGKSLIVKTNNVVTRYFSTQQNLLPK